MQEIIECLQEVADRGVETLEYFHCDHFEPWRRGVRMEFVDELAQFTELSQDMWYSKRLSLFYKPHVLYKYFEGAPVNMSVVPGEQIGFPHATEHQVAMARHAMGKIVADGHDIQVHLHHEGYTLSDVCHDVEVRNWLTLHGTEQGDESRLNVAIQLHLRAIRLETGLPLKRWAFVHGNWALNASDHRICRIKNEIKILMANGCVGDFTFPAGRKPVDPTIMEKPYTCIPNGQDKGYNLPEAKPLPLGDPAGRDEGRFFIWNSLVKHPYSSIDYHSKTVRAVFIEPNDVVVRWIKGAPIFDNKIYIKTHSHSMHRHYWEEMGKPVLPHQWPAVQLAFGRLRDACESVGITFKLTTVSEVYEDLMTGNLPTETPSLSA